MVALLGDVDAGFGILLLVIFLFFLVRMIFSGGEGNGTGASWDSRCKLIYEEALKDPNRAWDIRHAREMFDSLNLKEQEQVLSINREMIDPIRIGKTLFYQCHVMLIRGIWLADKKEEERMVRDGKRIRRKLGE